MQKKYLKYLTMVAAVSCCWVFAYKSTSSADAGKNIKESAICSDREINTSTSSVYENVNDSDKADGAYPKAKYKYEVDDNGDITIYPFLQYSYVNEDGDIAWSEPVKDIDKVKEYFNEDMVDIMSDEGKHKVDTSMLEE
ncbi:MAG: hypothetical protein HFH68_00830 [Lachnospiraceae bacterium]|nr:hypothetical protein [Lachnospiraceae bacterium]